jgi:preprotein translocase subunit SecF
MIELFKQPNIDWMGKAKYFYALSGLLLLAGIVSIVSHGGIRYGLDFKGGTNVDVRFAQPPNIDRLRSGLAAQGLGNSEIQSISDIANPNANEVVIGLEQKGQGDQALDLSKTQIINALNNLWKFERGRFYRDSASLTAFLIQRDPLLSDQRR